jgi:hypothetical protein
VDGVITTPNQAFGTSWYIMGKFGRQTISNKNKSLAACINAKQTEIIGETTSEGIGYLPPRAELQITKYEYCSYYVLF